MTRDEIEERANQSLIADLMQMGSILSAGDVIKGYCVIEMIGQGSFGQVFKVSKDERKFALKLCGAGQEGVEEIKFLKRLNGIQQVPDVVDSGGVEWKHASFFYFVQELASDAKDLLSRARINQWNLKQKINYFIKFCEVVNQIHAHDIIHSDLKPHNLLLDGKNQPWVIDFGLSSSYRGLPVFPQGRTPLYASPEQLKNEEITSKSDIFTLGVILCQLLVDQIPRKFSSDGRVETERVGEISANLSDDLVKIIEKCLREQPRDRYDTMAELIDSLESFQGLAGTGGYTAGEADDDCVSGAEESSKGNREKSENLFPDDPHTKVRKLLNHMLDVDETLKGMVNSIEPKVINYLGQGVPEETTSPNEVLPKFFRDLSQEIDFFGLKGVTANRFRTFVGGLLVLCVKESQVVKFRETVLEGILKIGDPDLLLGNELKDFLCHLPEIYHAAAADCLVEVERVFSERTKVEKAQEKRGIRRLPSSKDGTKPKDLVPVLLEEAVMEVMGCKADQRHFDGEGEKFEEVVAAVKEALQDGNPYQIHGLGELGQVLELLRASPYWGIFRYFVFYDISGENEAMIPGCRHIMPAFFKVLRSLEAASLNQKADEISSPS